MRLVITLCFFTPTAFLTSSVWGMEAPPMYGAGTESGVNDEVYSFPDGKNDGVNMQSFYETSPASNQKSFELAQQCPKTIQELVPHQHPGHGSLIGFYERDFGFRLGYVWSHTYYQEDRKEFFPAKHQDRPPNWIYEERYSYYPMNQDGKFAKALKATQSIVFTRGTIDLREETTSGVIYTVEWPHKTVNPHVFAPLLGETRVRVAISAFRTMEGVVKYVLIPPQKLQDKANDIDLPAYLYLIQVVDAETKQTTYELVPSNQVTPVS